MDKKKAIEILQAVLDVCVKKGLMENVATVIQCQQALETLITETEKDGK